MVLIRITRLVWNPCLDWFWWIWQIPNQPDRIIYQPVRIMFSRPEKLWTIVNEAQIKKKAEYESFNFNWRSPVSTSSNRESEFVNQFMQSQRGKRLRSNQIYIPLNRKSVKTTFNFRAFGAQKWRFVLFLVMCGWIKIAVLVVNWVRIYGYQIRQKHLSEIACFALIGKCKSSANSFPLNISLLFSFLVPFFFHVPKWANNNKKIST